MMVTFSLGNYNRARPVYLILNGSDSVLFVTATFLQVSTYLLDRLEHKPVQCVCVCGGLT